MATPAPAPAPAPAPTPSAPKPGYLTTEGWLSFLVALPGVILNSGLVANAPELVKILTLAASVLSTLGYTTNRTMLKRAHVLAGSAPANDNAAVQAARQAGFVHVGLMATIAVLGLACASLLAGCATTQKMTGTFATCEKADLGATLKTVPAQLASDLTLAGVSADQLTTANILTILSKLVQANLPTLEADLGILLGEVGLDTLECAYAALEAAFGPAQATPTPNTSPAKPSGLARMGTWLATQQTAK